MSKSKKNIIAMEGGSSPDWVDLDKKEEEHISPETLLIREKVKNIVNEINGFTASECDKILTHVYHFTRNDVKINSEDLDVSHMY